MLGRGSWGFGLHFELRKLLLYCLGFGWHLDYDRLLLLTNNTIIKTIKLYKR
jgi:hypothetical protein